MTDIQGLPPIPDGHGPNVEMVRRVGKWDNLPDDALALEDDRWISVTELIIWRYHRLIIARRCEQRADQGDRQAEKISDALGRLAACFEGGELMASADMAGFFDSVADEIERLRAIVGDLVSAGQRLLEELEHYLRQARGNQQTKGRTAR